MKEALELIEELIEDNRTKRNKLNVDIDFASRLQFNDEVSALHTKRNYLNKEHNNLKDIKDLIIKEG